MGQPELKCNLFYGMHSSKWNIAFAKSQATAPALTQRLEHEKKTAETPDLARLDDLASR